MLAPWKKSYDQHRQHIKKQRRNFANKGPSSQSYGLFSSHVWMWELDYKESWVLKNWCFWTVVLEKTLESPLDGKEIKPVNPKGNWVFPAQRSNPGLLHCRQILYQLSYQGSPKVSEPWKFIGRTDVEADAPILWPLDSKSQLIRKDLDAGKDGRQEKGTTEDEMVG